MTPLAWSALLVVYVVWGSTYLAIGYLIKTMPPLLSGGIRFTAAAVLLGAFLAVRHGPGALRVGRRELASAALVGVLLLAGGNGLVSVSEQHISTGLTALLVASLPLWLVLFRTAVGDRPRSAAIGGVAVGFAGVAMLSLFGDGGSGSGFGVLVALLAALSWAIGSFIAGRLPMPGSSFSASFYEMGAGGLALIAIGLARGDRVEPGEVSGQSWAALAYLIVFGSLLAFTCYAWLLGHAPLSVVGTYAYVNPAVAVALGALFMSEPVTWQTLAGGSVIIAGVGIVVATERRGTPHLVQEMAPEVPRARPGGGDHR